MSIQAREVVVFVGPLLTLLLALGVMGAPAVGLDVPQAQLAGAALVTLSVVLLVISASRGAPHD